jgi:hypothetical protein
MQYVWVIISAYELNSVISGYKTISTNTSISICESEEVALRQRQKTEDAIRAQLGGVKVRSTIMRQTLVTTANENLPISYTGRSLA